MNKGCFAFKEERLLTTIICYTVQWNLYPSFPYALFSRKYRSFSPVPAQRPYNYVGRIVPWSVSHSEFLVLAHNNIHGMIVSEKNSESKLICLERTVAVIQVHCHFWEFNETMRCFWECIVPVLYHNANITMPQPSEKFWWRGGAEGEALMARMWGQWRWRQTWTWTRAISYTHIISECDEQNILKLELALFHLKRNVSTSNWHPKTYFHIYIYVDTHTHTHTHTNTNTNTHTHITISWDCLESQKD
jgi:hypothetical protein